MHIKDFTKDDVRNVYRFLLGREPESEAVVEQHFNSCCKLSDLLQRFYRSPEFQNRIKKPQTIDQGVLSNTEEETLALVKIDNKTFEMAGDDYLKFHIRNEFEPNMVYLSKSLINKTDNVLDIGANIGCTSILFGGLANKVVCFEPNPSTFGFLKRNILNSKLKNIEVQNIGLGASAGEFEMAFGGNNRSGAFINDYQLAPSNHEKAKVRIERLDDVVGKLQLSKIDFMKIDVEGFEKQVLEGAGETIEKNKPVVVLEMNHWCLNAIQRICIPDFLDYLRSKFPILLAVEGQTYANLYDKDDSFSVMGQHILHFKYIDIVAAFEESKLSGFRALYKK